MTDTERERVLWMALRDVLLLAVEAIERFLDIAPRTAEIRAKYKRRDM